MCGLWMRNEESNIKHPQPRKWETKKWWWKHLEFSRVKCYVLCTFDVFGLGFEKFIDLLLNNEYRRYLQTDLIAISSQPPYENPPLLHIGLIYCRCVYIFFCFVLHFTTLLLISLMSWMFLSANVMWFNFIITINFSTKVSHPFTIYFNERSIGKKNVHTTLTNIHYWKHEIL